MRSAATLLLIQSALVLIMLGNTLHAADPQTRPTDSAAVRAALAALVKPQQSADAIVHAMTDQQRAATEDVPALIDLLRDRDPQIAALASARLCTMWRKAMPALVDALRDKDPAVRKEADRALDRINAAMDLEIASQIRPELQQSPKGPDAVGRTDGAKPPASGEAARRAPPQTPAAGQTQAAAAPAGQTQAAAAPAGQAQAAAAPAGQTQAAAAPASAPATATAPPEDIFTALGMQITSNLDDVADKVEELPRSGKPREKILEILREAIRSPYSVIRITGVTTAASMGADARSLLPDVDRLAIAGSDHERAVALDAMPRLGPLTPQGLEALIWNITAGHPLSGVRAARAAAKFGEAAVGAHKDLLRRASQDGPVGEEAAIALASMGKKGLEDLVSLVTSGSGSTRQRAIRAVGSMGAEAKSAVPMLLDRLKESKDEDRLAIADALSRIEPGAPELVRAIIEIARNPQDPLRDQIVELLERIAPKDPRAPAALVDAIRDPGLGDHAAEAVMRVAPGIAEMLTPVQMLLDEPDRTIRLRALRVLAVTGPGTPDALPALLRIFGGGDGEMRPLAAQALARMGPAARSARGPLLGALSDPSIAVRGSAASALIAISPGDDALGTALLDAVQRKDYVIRVLLAPSLRAQAARSPSLVPRLLELHRNGADDDVRGNAHYALRDLGIDPEGK